MNTRELSSREGHKSRWVTKTVKSGTEVQRHQFRLDEGGVLVRGEVCVCVSRCGCVQKMRDWEKGNEAVEETAEVGGK